MGNLVVVGLRELQPLFGAYEQYVGQLWNVFQALMIVHLYGTAPRSMGLNTAGSLTLRPMKERGRGSALKVSMCLVFKLSPYRNLALVCKNICIFFFSFFR